MLINIQFLRLIAAMLVVFYHTSAHVVSTGVDQGAFFALSEAIGFAGVDVFFVISGFIMAHTSLGAVGVTGGWAFLRRRFARIYSGYWPFLVLALLLFTWIDPAAIQQADLLSNVLLWPTYPLLIAVSWTLIFEMFFYLLFTLVIIFTNARRSLVLLTMFTLLTFWALYTHFVRHAYDTDHLVFMSMAEYYMLSPYVLEFLGGALLAGWMTGPLATSSAEHHRPLLLPGLLMLLTGSSLFLAGGWINNHYFDGGIEQGYYIFYRVLVFGIPSLLILAGLVRLDQAGLQAPLRISLLGGGASYAIYLSHTLILVALQTAGFNDFAGRLDGWVMQVVYLLLTLAILVYSVLHYRWIERPLHGAFKKWLKVS